MEPYLPPEDRRRLDGDGRGNGKKGRRLLGCKDDKRLSVQVFGRNTPWPGREGPGARFSGARTWVKPGDHLRTILHDLINQFFTFFYVVLC